jgi:SAM-dependent methyltransferase
MRTEWDQRARENARRYVATLQDDWASDDVLKSGKIWIDEYVMPVMDQLYAAGYPSEMRMLELGCGAGRMTVAFSSIFGYVDAVDISAEMIARAKDSVRDCRNVAFHVTNGADLSMFSDGTFDFVFSALVFQHIPRKSIIKGYVKEVSRVLRPGRVFRFQLQGYPIAEEYADTWLGVGFSETEVARIAQASGFTLHSSTGGGTQDYWVTLIKK